MTTIAAERMAMPPHEIDRVWHHIARDAWRYASPDNVAVARDPATGDIAMKLLFAGVSAVLHASGKTITSREDIARGEWVFSEPKSIAHSGKRRRF